MGRRRPLDIVVGNKHREPNERSPFTFSNDIHTEPLGSSPAGSARAGWRAGGRAGRRNGGTIPRARLHSYWYGDLLMLVNNYNYEGRQKRRTIVMDSTREGRPVKRPTDGPTDPQTEGQTDGLNGDVEDEDSSGRR